MIGGHGAGAGTSDREVQPDGKGFVVVLDIHGGRQAHLLIVAQAGGLPRLLTGLRKDREQNGRQDGDNGDNNEQLDQGETVYRRLQGRSTFHVFSLVTGNLRCATFKVGRTVRHQERGRISDPGKPKRGDGEPEGEHFV